MIVSRLTPLLVATSNIGKLREFDSLAELGFELLHLERVGLVGAEETGTTFRENALIKALAAAKSSGMPTLADDSGLVVPSLAGAPGVYSARYAGTTATDAENRQKLRHEISERGLECPDAHFVCVLAFIMPSGKWVLVEGHCGGRISSDERGTKGFGYDSVFELPNGKTMAELTPTEKQHISHRGRAIEKLIPLLIEHKDDLISLSHDFGAEGC